MSTSDVMEEQLKTKLAFINKPYETTDKYKCKKVASALEQSIRSTLYSSKANETLFRFPFQKGCGKEVSDMISTYKLEPMISLNESIHTVEEVCVFFNLESKKVNVLLTNSVLPIK